MNQLSWTQTDKIVIASVEIDDIILKFPIENKIINNLINHTPKVYYFKVNYDGSEYNYIADFDGLKPVVRNAQKLSVKIKMNKSVDKVSLAEFCYYTIARGESFMERYMGIKGWQTQEYNFKIIKLDEANKPIKNQTQPENLILQNTITEEHKSTKPQSTIIPDNNIIKCSSCGFETSTNIDVCPNCFTLLVEGEDDVDFAI